MLSRSRRVSSTRLGAGYAASPCEGLPEAGAIWSKGQFDRKGLIPQIRDPRVRFFKGRFDEVLPKYTLPAHEVMVINLDSDIYSSAIYVLPHLREKIVAGTFVYFDEMNHMEHEPRAFDDFLRESRLKFRAVCADGTLAQVCFECVALSPGDRRGCCRVI